MEIALFVIVGLAILYGVYYAGYRRGEADTNIRRNRIPQWRK